MLWRPAGTRKEIYFGSFVGNFIGSMTRFLIAMVLAVQISARADLVKSSILESNAVYLRVGNVDKKLPQEVQTAVETLAATNQVAGTVLDLRFAGGDDSDAAKAVANSLPQKSLPLAVLVNNETTGAAIELAESLRDSHAGLIFGSSTNVPADISISVSAGNEKQFLENPWGTVSTNDLISAVNPGYTNKSFKTDEFLPYVDHTTEADLVRARIKDGEEDDTIAKPAPPKPFIRDPVLARGLDFVKGMAVLRLSHS